MSKYANLPDVDIEAPDVYETEDVPEPSAFGRTDSDDEDAPTGRLPTRGKSGTAGPDELDSGSLNMDDATKRFRKAERKKAQTRSRYTYPPSPTVSTASEEAPDILTVTQRLSILRAELALLEDETSSSLADLPDGESGTGAEAGELLRELADVRGRLERIQTTKKARIASHDHLIARAVADAGPSKPESIEEQEEVKEPVKVDPSGTVEESVETTASTHYITEMDRRVGQLEELVGSASASLDEMSPMPPPLLPMLTRLNAQLTLLTQPRHIDAASRRLKLLLSDLDRVSAQHARRGQSQTGSAGSAATTMTNAEQLAPVLTRLIPLLPHISHVLARLRTLATLHASAAEFESALGSLESEQRRQRGSLDELTQAVDDMEKSLADNRELVKSNVEGLEGRITKLLERLEALEA